MPPDEQKPTHHPEIQVPTTHYAWGQYATRQRWSSYWHQVTHVIEAAPLSCLIIGAGDGLVAEVLRRQGIRVDVCDFDPDIGADIVGDVRSLPIDDDAYEVTVCAQVLEHIPGSDLPAALGELARVTTQRTVVSVPQHGRVWELSFRVPPWRRFARGGVLPARTAHVADEQHQWELGGGGLPRSEFERMVRKRFTLAQTYAVPDNPYHRFYVLDPARR